MSCNQMRQTTFILLLSPIMVHAPPFAGLSDPPEPERGNLVCWLSGEGEDLWPRGERSAHSSIHLNYHSSCLSKPWQRCCLAARTPCCSLCFNCSTSGNQRPVDNLDFTPSHQCSSADTRTHEISPVHTKTNGQCAFSYSIPTLWNSPSRARSESAPSFRSAHKLTCFSYTTSHVFMFVCLYDCRDPSKYMGKFDRFHLILTGLFLMCYKRFSIIENIPHKSPKAPARWGSVCRSIVIIIWTLHSALI